MTPSTPSPTPPASGDPLDGWLTVTEAAQKLGYSRIHIKRLIRMGELAGRQTTLGWVVSAMSVEQAIRHRRGGGASAARSQRP